MKQQMLDRFGRIHTNLRISVTDVCNFRCIYCMPEDMTFMPDAALMTFDEILHLARIFVALGANKVRITGGEPLVRPGVPALIRQLTQLEGLKDISLTTNGIGLIKQAQALYDAGLRRINVSLDTLNEEKFEQMTRRKVLSRVLEGLKAAHKCGFNPIKINAVAMRGFTDDEIVDLATFARQNDYQLRFIEFMPLDADDVWGRNMYIPGKEIIGKINAVYPLTPVTQNGEAKSDTAQRYRFSDSENEVGVISSVSEPFCENCNRVRLTADGKLRTCLFSLTETDLLTPLREGVADDGIAELILNAVEQKEAGHKINAADFIKPERNMSRIGG
ncbi:GTP 3',8-cyclase [Geodia barretti]|uniref:GTP 3',8-cyclase n=2 Tax=Geodia barretti TaxID=519541 RepID=A0AA35TV89_GEOBA|nr:GTP 3',8-cyclase [Geodia barretti]